MESPFGARRAVYSQVQAGQAGGITPLSAQEKLPLEQLDVIYRSLCAMLYNYTPTSGHPGGSLSSGRIVECLLFATMDYELGQPLREDADIICYAAGHKALGLYALWALRTEAARIGAPRLLPDDPRLQLRLEDLLGFRRNRSSPAPLFRKYDAKPLDGHPTPATPFVRVATGASGTGLGSAVGLAIAALDSYGANAPRVHVIEGEGGLTPGRAAEALAAAGTSSVGNLVLHVDWNQASIDSNRVCREGDAPGDYVQWDPRELAYLNDWNVIWVPDGEDFDAIAEAQRRALSLDNGQPTAIVYRTVKGRGYGIQGRASHGAGHGLCADGYFEAVRQLFDGKEVPLPRCEAANRRCAEGSDSAQLEECYWSALSLVRRRMQDTPALAAALCRGLSAARERLDRRGRGARPGHPDVQAVYQAAARGRRTVPAALRLAPGTVTTLRGELARALAFYNTASGGALLCASADLMGSTSLSAAGKGFPEGFFNGARNPGARLLSTGGICEDAMAAILGGISSYGHAIGVGSSYAGFLAPLAHIAARLHAIGGQARGAVEPGPCRPLILVCAHAGLKTGEDGPTHADPQALQVLQENFPRGTAVTLTPLDPQEVWYLLAAALARRPSVIAPFVTRPAETIFDRAARGLSLAASAAAGVYCLRPARGRKPDGAVVLQGSEVGFAFVEETMPLLEKRGLDIEAYYVASAELFDLQAPAARARLFPRRIFETALGITGFTLSTMYRWIGSPSGRAMTLYPFRGGHYLGSGSGKRVMEEAGLDGRSQYAAIRKHLDRRGK
jgi:transketolase